MGLRFTDESKGDHVSRDDVPHPTTEEMQVAAEAIVLEHGRASPRFWQVDLEAMVESMNRPRDGWDHHPLELGPRNVYSRRREPRLAMSYTEAAQAFSWASEWVSRHVLPTLLHEQERESKSALAELRGKRGIWGRQGRREEIAYLESEGPQLLALERSEEIARDLMIKVLRMARSLWTERVASQVAAGEWMPAAMRPLPPTTPQEAEVAAVAWMHVLGVEDARVTPKTRDGGIDVISRAFVVQVKHQSTPVAPAPVRQIVGVAAVERKHAVFFALEGYSSATKAFADEAGVALFVYRTGELMAASDRATLALKVGLVKAYAL